MVETLGVLGGGQLGRYFVLAAQSLGFRTVVLEPDRHSPAGAVADEHVVAAYDDLTALEYLATACVAVTVEFENPPADSLEFLAERMIVRPSPHAVAITQDRRLEKHLCERVGLAVAPWWEISDATSAIRLMEELQTDAPMASSSHRAFILKTARLGYDGKGQHRLTDITKLLSIWREMGSVPCVLETLVPLDAEISIILARGSDGAVATYDVTRNVHQDGILDTSCAPFDINFAGMPPIQNSAHLVAEARLAATTLAMSLDYVGVLAVEFFISNGRLLVNELAPRPHNSGHWTLDSAQTNQFEQQVRALAGMPLGATDMLHSSVAMANLLGDRWRHGEPHFDHVHQHSNVRLHLYGKHQARPGRKMGHLTCFAGERPDSDAPEPVLQDVLAQVRALRETITVSDGNVVCP